MRNIIVVVMAFVFMLAITGLGFSAERTTLAMNMNHGDSAVCNIPNCCQNHQKATEQKTEATKGEAVPHRIIDLQPSDG